jgi:antigen flippase
VSHPQEPPPHAGAAGLSPAAAQHLLRGKRPRLTQIGSEYRTGPLISRATQTDFPHGPEPVLLAESCMNTLGAQNIAAESLSGCPGAVVRAPDDLGTPTERQTQEREGRRAFKSAAMMAASSLSGTVIGLASTKAVAAIYGPSGTATIGLLAAAYSTLALVFGLGIDQAGTKRIAETRDRDPARSAVITRTALCLTIFLSVVAAAVTLAAAPFIANLVLGTPKLTTDVRVIAIVVALTIATGGPAAYLHGTRQISRLAVAGPIGSLLGTIVSVTALLLHANLIWATLVVAQIISTGTFLILGRHAFSVARRPGTRASLAEARGLLSLGSVFAGGGLAILVSGLVLRVIITRTLGLSATGQFQAAFGTTSTAFAFILAALTTDFYPRLTQAGRDNTETTRITNHQLEFSLLLLGPLALATILGAPLGIRLLYSHAYAPAIWLTQFFALSEFLRAISWNIGFIMPAREAKAAFLIGQVTSAVTPLLLYFVLLPRFGLRASAAAEIATQLVMVAYVTVAAKRYASFRFSQSAKRRSVGIGLACVASALAGALPYAFVLHAALLAAVALISLRILCRDLGIPMRNLPRQARSRGLRLP